MTFGPQEPDVSQGRATDGAPTIITLPAPSPRRPNAAQTLEADFTGDGDVDLEDFAFFQACYTGPGGLAEPPCDAADLDRDGDVDVRDFYRFVPDFTGPR